MHAGHMCTAWPHGLCTCIYCKHACMRESTLAPDACGGEVAKGASVFVPSPSL